MYGCADSWGCTLIALPSSARELVRCPLHNDKVQRQANFTRMPLLRQWLDEDAEEEPMAVASVPCDAGECLVLGTSEARLVELARATSEGSSGGAAELHVWAPRRALAADVAATAGTLALLDDGKVGILGKEASMLRVMDDGGAIGGQWRMPPAPDGLHWSSICASGDSVFALESGPSPSVWRFPQSSLLNPLRDLGL